MGALDQLGTVFPPERGAIWFAAGVSFTSFSLVYAIAVLTVEVHDGLEINLLGLARWPCPTRRSPIAQIELALQARISTAEGVFSVQAQLTENSWLINESCRLTGGFAFVMWFKGELAGQFVLSLGGYHPDFDKPAAFPVVPRRRLRLGAGCRRLDQGRRLLRADLDLRDGRRLARGVVQELDRVGEPRGRRRHPRVLGPVLLRLQGLRPDLGRHRHRGLLLRLRPRPDELLVQRRGAHRSARSCAARSSSTSTSSR